MRPVSLGERVLIRGLGGRDQTGSDRSSRAAEELGALNTQLGAVLMSAVLGLPLLLKEGHAAMVAATAAGAGAPVAATTGGVGVGVKALAVTAVVVGGGLAAGLLLWPSDEEPTQVQQPVPVKTTQAPQTLEPNSPEPTPTPTSTPTQSAPSAEPSQSPTAEPSSTPTPPAPPPPPPPGVVLGSPSTERLATDPVAWSHVEIPVSGSPGALEMTIQLTNVADHTVHRDDVHGAWNCNAAGASRLVCRLPASSSLRTLGIDLSPAGNGPMRLSATVGLVGVDDQDRSRTSTAITVPNPRGGAD